MARTSSVVVAAAMALGVGVFGGVAQAQPVNDECPAAITVTASSTTMGSNVGGVGADITSCALNDAIDVWYTFTPLISASYRIDTEGTAAGDTTLSVFNACDGSELACDDDGGTGLLSLITVTVSAGQTVKIRAAGYNNSQVDFVMNIDAGAPVPPPPANDACAAAELITLPFGATVDVAGATADLDTACNAAAAAETVQGVWYTYTPAISQVVRIEETGTLNTIVAIFTGGCGGLAESRCSDPENFLVALAAGVQYHILLAPQAATGVAPGAAPIQFGITEVTPPGNDQCGAAEMIGSLPFVGSADGGSATPDLDVACNIAAATSTFSGVWYSYTPASNQTVRFRETGTGNTVISIFSGGCAGLVEVRCSDPEDFVHALAGGTTYHVLVGAQAAADLASGVSIGFEMSEVAVPANDGCGEAALIAALPFTGAADAGYALSDIDVSCNAAAAAETFSGVWYTYTPASNQTVRFRETGAGNTVISIFSGGCAGLVEVRCSDPEDFIQPLIGGTAYHILVGSQANAPLTPPGAIGFEMTAVFTPANDDCATATSVAALPLTVSVDLGYATPDIDASCNAAAATATNNGVWFRYTPAETQLVRFQETGTSNVVISIFAGGCAGLTELRCSDPEDFAQELSAGTEYHILLGAQAAAALAPPGAATFTISAVAPPVNDSCDAATEVMALPFTVTQETGFAQPDADVSCNAAAATQTNNGIWFTFTPAETVRVRFQETGTSNTVIAIHTGGCAGLLEELCSDPEDLVRELSAGTTYHILVGAQSATALAPPGNMTLVMSEVLPPTNDTCDTAQVITTLPLVESRDHTTATNDLDVACNAAANFDSRLGVWYRLTTTEPGTITLNETSANDVIFTLFTGGCGGLLEGACNGAEPSNLALAAATTYEILVSMNSATTVPTTALALNFSFTPAPGACCTPSGCLIVAGSAACQPLGGTWQGSGVTCGGPTGYTIESSAGVFAPIGAMGGTQLATVSGCDDCGETIPIGFVFNYLGTTYENLWVCSNGFVQFGTPTSTTFTNAVIPTNAAPNNFICVLWDDWNLGTAGDAYWRLDGVAPNRSLVVSWENVTQHALATPDNNSFQVVLSEGSNAVEFRYGLLTAETAVNDYTIGYEDAAGSSGASIPGADLGAGVTARNLVPANVQANPCGAGAPGACCAGSSCSVVAQPACTGAGTRFVGSGSACNASGNNTTPCCRADFNQDGAVAVQDILDYLGAWFVRAPSAEFDGAPTVTLQDLFDFLGGWFARCP